MTPVESFDILGFGAVAVDELLYVDEYPAVDRKVRVRKRLRQCGGQTGTALVAAARLGARCAYVGTLGDDPLSREVADCLAREGIRLDQAASCPRARPAYSTILVDSRHKTRTIFCSLEGPIGAAEESPSEELIRAAAVLLVDHHGLAGTLRAARIARAAGVPLVADLESNPGPPFDAVLEAVDHLIISHHFAQELTAKTAAADTINGLWNENRSVVAVTCGAEGCWYRGAESNAIVHLPAPPVDAVDTTGCGDVFHGVYAATLAWGMPLAQRLWYASGAAALKATRPGGQSGIPDRPTLEAFLSRIATTDSRRG